ncbi:MAG: DUF1415 domain-containing protein [Bacteroidota bacterium]
MEQKAIRITQNWIERWIIAHQVCPFASKVYRLEQIHYRVLREVSFEQKLLAVQQMLQILDEQKQWDTALLIFPQSFQNNFLDYLDFLALAEMLLKDLNYEGVYQIASFHPQYQFAGSTEEDPANYTNRSPFPMLHFLREASVERVLQQYQNPVAIPDRNIDLARDQGLNYLQRLLKSCHQ